MYILQVFSGLIDSRRLLKTVLDPPVSAAHVRIAPTAFAGLVCMRAELYGWTVDNDSVHDWGKQIHGISETANSKCAVAHL